MRIARIETFLLHPGSGKNLLFARVETDDGFYGWGEAYVTRGKEKVIEECVTCMVPYLIGRSSFSIRHLGQVLFDDFAIRRASMELLSAWSAVEIALWDILGKRAGLPVYNLLGGASRDRVRVYANGWSDGGSIVMGFAATMHVCATIPNFRIAEYFVNFVDTCGAVATSVITVKDGWAELPTAPGLGVDIDIERLRKCPYKEFAHKPLTLISEEFPRRNYAPGG